MQHLAEIITRFVDFFYRPVRFWVSRQLFTYAACGSANMVLDWVLYFLVYNFVVGHQLVYITLWFSGFTLCLTPHIASLCLVFPVTLFTGFWLNRHVTFAGSSLRGHRQLLRYILVVALNLAINYFGLKLCVELWHWYPTPSKMFITLLTVLVSFFGQKYFSFKK